MMIKNEKLYDVLKYVSRYVIPALIVLYVALADTWQLPLKTEIAATLAAVEVFLNTLLGISNENYNKVKTDE